jgi:biotin carboxyl carrier protein
MWMKKKYVLTIGEARYTATLAHEEGRTAVQIDDGELHEIDAELLHGGRALSLRIDGRMHLVDLTSGVAPGAVAASVDGRAVDLTVMDELRAMALQAESAAGGDGEVHVDIPGLVVAVHVAAGQTVAKGDTLLVVEAMKMQNEIAAPVDGTVAEVLVKTGQSVNAGDSLLRIEAGG